MEFECLVKRCQFDIFWEGSERQNKKKRSYEKKIFGESKLMKLDKHQSFLSVHPLDEFPQ